MTPSPNLKPIVRVGLLPAVTVSAIVVNTSPADRAAIVRVVGSSLSGQWIAGQRRSETQVQSTLEGEITHYLVRCVTVMFYTNLGVL